MDEMRDVMRLLYYSIHPGKFRDNRYSAQIKRGRELGENAKWEAEITCVRPQATRFSDFYPFQNKFAIGSELASKHVFFSYRIR